MVNTEFVIPALSMGHSIRTFLVSKVAMVWQYVSLEICRMLGNEESSEQRNINS